jgi:hypothetical protein
VQCTACSSISSSRLSYDHFHSHNKVDDSIMKKRDTRTGPGNSTAEPSSARPATPQTKSGILTAFTSTKDRKATTSAVNVGEFCRGGNIFVVSANTYWCRPFSSELAF